MSWYCKRELYVKDTLLDHFHPSELSSPIKTGVVHLTTIQRKKITWSPLVCVFYQFKFVVLFRNKNMKNSQYWSKYVFKNCIFPSVSNDISSPPRWLHAVLAYNDVIFSAEKILMHIPPSLYIVKSENWQPEIQCK